MHTLSLLRRSLATALIGGLLATTLPAVAAGEYIRPGVSFALIGDTPYGVAEEPKFDRVIADINASRNVRFVLHTGDVKQGSERCDDAVFIRRFNQYQGFDDAFIVTPGDNDWTDCHRTNNGSYLPTERLAKFREIFYPVIGRSTGKRQVALLSQAATPGHAAHAAYVENTLWQFAGATMATVHVVGSANNLAPWNQLAGGDRPAERQAEFDARLAASLAWIDEVFNRATAARSAGVLLAMQANPGLESAAGSAARLGFDEVIARITARSIAFGKPVLLAHGDSHYFRLDKPLVNAGVSLENFTRLENFGSPNVHWVEVFVDPRDPNVFSVVPHVVAGNVVAR
ncbi:MAG: metallophosphoesterase [Pseudomonadota bacterium]